MVKKTCGEEQQAKFFAMFFKKNCLFALLRVFADSLGTQKERV